MGKVQLALLLLAALQTQQAASSMELQDSEEYPRIPMLTLSRQCELFLSLYETKEGKEEGGEGKLKLTSHPPSLSSFRISFLAYLFDSATPVRRSDKAASIMSSRPSILGGPSKLKRAKLPKDVSSSSTFLRFLNLPARSLAHTSCRSTFVFSL